VASLSDVVIKRHLVERPSWSGRPRSVEVVNVPVEFNLDWRPGRSDGSMSEGATTWGYLLERRTQNGPWRIFDQGGG
jgi:hypothetical protein